MLSLRAGLVGKVAWGQTRLSRDQEGPREVAAGPSAAPLSGERASHPSPLREPQGGRPPVRGSGFASAWLSVPQERARECEDAVDLLRVCDSSAWERLA